MDFAGSFLLRTDISVLIGMGAQAIQSFKKFRTIKTLAKDFVNLGQSWQYVRFVCVFDLIGRTNTTFLKFGRSSADPVKVGPATLEK